MIEHVHQTSMFVKRRALYSDSPLYRYLLEIIWDSRAGAAMFIGLNPSTATEFQNDPTLERCERFAKSWRCGGLLMTNLFAARETEPRRMKEWADPVGPENTIEFLKAQAARAVYVVAAWGNDGSWRGRDREVLNAMKLDCLRVSKTGAPCHPLYLPRALRPLPFNYQKDAYGIIRLS